MPALDPVPGVVAITMGYTIGVDTTTSNKLHARYTGTPPSNADCAALCTTFEQAFQAGPILSMGAWTFLTSVTVQDLSAPTGGYNKKNVNHQGTAGGGVVPANATALVSMAIQRRYRGGKPRTYTPMGTDTDLVDAQHWSAAAVTNFTTHWSTFNAPMYSATWTGGGLAGQVSVSYYSGATWTGNPDIGYKRHAKRRDVPLVDAVTSWKVEALVASQRRRVRGRLS